MNPTGWRTTLNASFTDMLQRNAFTFLAVVAGLAAGCAYGGGRGDSGTSGGFDAGPPVVGTDAGPLLRIDSGPGGGTDAGPGGGGFDAGPGGGTDAGPGGGSCAESPCRLVSPQCGCPGTQRCYVDTSSNRVCGAAGPEGEGQACSSPTACRAGLLCIGTPGHCNRFCNSDAECTGGPGSICGITLSDGAGGTVPNATLCSLDCDPLSAAGCPSGQACTLYRESAGAMRTFTDCRAAGTGTSFSPCFDETDCQTGFFCADIGFGDECVPFCRDDFDCGIFEVCTAFDPALRVGSTEYGYCY